MEDQATGDTLKDVDSQSGRLYGMLPGGRWFLMVWACAFCVAGVLFGLTTSRELGYAPPIFIIGCGLACAWLVWASSALDYEVTPQGLLIHRPNGDHLAPWDLICAIKWSPELHVMWFKSASGNWAFLSSDYFPYLPELVATIVDRSGCKVDARVQKVLDELHAGHGSWKWWPHSLRWDLRLR